MTSLWSAEQLDRISRSGELLIATRRSDGSLREWVPIWVVCVDGGVYVRSWYRRTTGWFGHVISLPRARIRVPGLEIDVVIADVGAADPDLRANVDAAYGMKYGSGQQSMITDDAAATTLRLDPQ